MHRDRVVLDVKQRRAVCDLFVESLKLQGVEVIAVCIGARHFHLLARFWNGHRIGDGKYVESNGRILIGKAKGGTATILGKDGVVPKGGIWGKRCRCRPVADRKHQLNIVRYVLNHRKKGAATWLIEKESGMDDTSSHA